MTLGTIPDASNYLESQQYAYRLPTNLREGNDFTGVCHSAQG